IAFSRYAGAAPGAPAGLDGLASVDMTGNLRAESSSQVGYPSFPAAPVGKAGSMERTGRGHPNAGKRSGKVPRILGIGRIAAVAPPLVIPPRHQGVRRRSADLRFVPVRTERESTLGWRRRTTRGEPPEPDRRPGMDGEGPHTRRDRLNIDIFHKVLESPF